YWRPGEAGCPWSAEACEDPSASDAGLPGPPAAAAMPIMAIAMATAHLNRLLTISPLPRLNARWLPMATIGTLAIRITANAVEFERRMEQVSKTLRRAEREFGRASRRMMQIGQQWAWGITAPILAGIGAVTKAVTHWEDD